MEPPDLQPVHEPTDPEQAPASGSAVAKPPHLCEVVTLFLRLGFTAFGGPAAHIAMMRDEVVRRRRWISDERFVDLLGITNLIPGPSSTELAIYLGYLRVGWPGLLAAGVCFIGPAMLIVLALAWAYVTYGTLPQVGWLFSGIQPVVVAIIAQAIWNLGRTIFKGVLAAVLAVLVLVLYLLGVNVLLLLFGGAALYSLLRLLQKRWSRPPALSSVLLPVVPMSLRSLWKGVLPTLGAGWLTGGASFSWSSCSRSSNWGWWSTGAAIRCWPSCGRTWCRTCTG